MSSLFLLVDYFMIRTGGLALCRTNWEVLPKKISFAELRPREPIMTMSILFFAEFANFVISYPGFPYPIFSINSTTAFSLCFSAIVYLSLIHI